MESIHLCVFFTFLLGSQYFIQRKPYKHASWSHYKLKIYYTTSASLVAQTVKRLPTIRETQVRSLGQEDPQEKEVAIHSSTLALKIPRMKEPGRLQSIESQRVRYNWATSLSFHTPLGKIWKLLSNSFNSTKQQFCSCSQSILLYIIFIYILYKRIPISHTYKHINYETVTTLFKIWKLQRKTFKICAYITIFYVVFNFINICLFKVFLTCEPKYSTGAR